MNTPLIVLWIFVFCILIVLVVFGIRNANQAKADKAVYTVNFNQNTCYPNGTSDSLPDAGNICCVVNGVTSTKKPYIIPNTNLTMIIDIVPQNYLEVCNDYCLNINPITGKCEDTKNTKGSSYIQCLTALTPPKGCYDFSLPLAQYKGNIYYAQAPQILATNPGAPNNISGNCDITAVC